jgi:hypothetical protein
VLMPSTYNPYSLAPIDASHSPFLVSLQKLYQARKCLEDQNAKPESGVYKILSDIDAYLAALSGSAGAPGKTNPPPENGKANPGNPESPAPSSPTTPHLMSVLSGDGLAQAIGVVPDTGRLDETVPEHILLLKAMESGGTVEKTANIFGTKVRYSGGSVGTYTLFTIDGKLECSGNVYEYGGSFPAKDFQKGLRGYVPDPGKQFIFQHSSCHR